MKSAEHSGSWADIAKDHANGNSVNGISRLRELVSDLINEVESLDPNSLSLSEAWVIEHCDSISFYEAVTRFEITLIKNALRRTEGNQVQAARLLNLHRSTLNAKIKHYHIGQSCGHTRR